MPELPEVEVVKRSLESKIQNKIIKKVKINDIKLRYKLNIKKISQLNNLKIKKIERRSKYLLFHFDKPIIMLVHLGMTGKFFFINENKKKFKTSFYYNLNEAKDQKYDRVIFFLKNRQKFTFVIDDLTYRSNTKLTRNIYTISIAIVTYLPGECFLHSIIPAKSICDKSQPPKISPLLLMQEGIAKALIERFII